MRSPINCKGAVAESGSARWWLEAANVSRRAATGSSRRALLGICAWTKGTRGLGYGVMLGRWDAAEESPVPGAVTTLVPVLTQADRAVPGSKTEGKPENLVATRNGGSAGEKE